MIKYIAPLIFLSSYANATAIQQNGIGKQSITVSSLTASNLIPNAIVTTSSGGLLVSQSTLTLTSTGNVGINLASPATTFHVQGSSTSRAILVNSPPPNLTPTAGTTVGEIALFATPYAATSVSMLDLLSYSTTSLANPLYRIANHWEAGATSGTIAIGSYVGTTFTDVLNIATGTARSQATTSGAVGVMTLNPASTLDINGNMSVGTYAGANAAPSNGLIISGNVGIGTPSPSSLITVSSGTLLVDGTAASINLTASNATITVNSNDANAGQIKFQNAGTNKSYVLNEQTAGAACTGTSVNDLCLRTDDGTNGNIALATAGGGTRMFITRAGNVGIGTNAPGALFDVRGASFFGTAPTQSTMTASGYYAPPSYTTAQLATGSTAPAPTQIGLEVFNSTIKDVCVSTGTTAGNWALAGSKGATGCY